MSGFKIGGGVRGFTLIELMIVVAILCILAGVAIPSYIGYVRRSRVSEAISSIAMMKTAEEEYAASRTTSKCYLPAGAYPVTAPTSAPQTWVLPVTVPAWGTLGIAVTPNRSVWFQYEVYASSGGDCGAAAVAPTAAVLMGGAGVDYCGIGDATITAWLNQGGALLNWYIVVARGDMNGDGVFGQVISFIGESNVIQCHETD